MTSSNSSFTPENIVSGAGVWAPGKTVREIEGHFHPENEPKGAVPISETGGVPKVDFHPSNLLHHGSGASGSHSGSGLTGTHTGTGSGLTGTRGTGSGLTGDHAPSSGAGSGLTGSHHDNTTHDGKKPGLAEKVKDAVTGDKSAHDYDSNRDHHTSNATGLNGQTGKTGHSDFTGTTAAPVGTTGSSSTATQGATHGISDSAERDLQHNSGAHSSRLSHGTTGAGATGAGLTGAGLTGAGATGAGLTGAGPVTNANGGVPGTVASNHESGGSGIATHLRNSVDSKGHTGDVTSGRTGDVTTGRTGDVAGTNAMTGSTTGTTAADHSTTGHHTSTTHGSKDTTHGTDSPKKEGFLAKVKNALH